MACLACLTQLAVSGCPQLSSFLVAYNERVAGLEAAPIARKGAHTTLAHSLPPCSLASPQLSPLLAAYDRRVAVLEAALGARKEGLQGIQAEVEALASENSTLHSQLAKQATLLEARRLQACAGAGAGVEHVRLQVRFFHLAFPLPRE